MMGKRTEELIRARALKAVGEKWCPACAKALPLVAFQSVASRYDGLEWRCTECKRAAGRKYVESHKTEMRRRSVSWYNRNREHAAVHRKAYVRSNRQRIAEVNGAYKRRHPLRCKAKNAVQTALRNGSLCKTPCFHCGESRVDGHHPSYSREDWLSVVWLCRRCHRQTHSIAADLVSKP